MNFVGKRLSYSVSYANCDLDYDKESLSSVYNLQLLEDLDYERCACFLCPGAALTCARKLSDCVTSGFYVVHNGNWIISAFYDGNLIYTR